MADLTAVLPHPLPYCMDDAYWAELAQPETGHVYFVGAYFPRTGELEFIKIGYSRSVEYRAGVVASQMKPFHGVVMATCPGGMDRERAYHMHFAEHQCGSELFRAHPDVVAEIDRLSLPTGGGA